MYNFNLRNGSKIDDNSFDRISNDLICSIKLNMKIKKIFGYINNKNIFSNSDTDLYIFEGIDFSKNPRILIVDDVCLKSIYELNKINYTNYQVAISDKNYLRYMKILPYVCLSNLIQDKKIVLLDSIKDEHYDIVITTNPDLVFDTLTDFDDLISISVLTVIDRYYNKLITIKTIEPKKLNLTAGSNYFKYRLSNTNTNYLYNSKEDFDYDFWYNPDFKKIYKVNVNHKHTYNFNIFNKKQNYNSNLILINTDSNKGNGLIKNANLTLDEYEKVNSNLKCICLLFNSEIEHNNYINFINRRKHKGLAQILLIHPSQITFKDLINVDWSHPWSYREILTEYGYSEEEIEYLFNKYDWNEIGDVK